MVTTLAEDGVPAQIRRLLAVLGAGLVALAGGGTLVYLVGLGLHLPEHDVASGRETVLLVLVAAAVPFVVALALERWARRWYDSRVRLLVASVVGALSTIVSFLLVLAFTISF